LPNLCKFLNDIHVTAAASCWCYVVNITHT